MAIILNVGIVLIPFQSKVIYLYALPIILFTRDILVKPVEPELMFLKLRGLH